MKDMKDETSEHSPDLSRRGWLAGVIYSLTSLIGGTFAASVGTYLFGTPTAKNLGWADAAELSDLKAGAPQQISFEQSREDGWAVRNEKASAWVVIDRQKQVTAFSPLCTHLGCAYLWQEERKNFACPCHGSLFSITGDVIAGPASRPLDRYSVKVEGGRLWLGPIQGSEDA